MSNVFFFYISIFYSNIYSSTVLLAIIIVIITMQEKNYIDEEWAIEIRTNIGLPSFRRLGLSYISMMTSYIQ